MRATWIAGLAAFGVLAAGLQATPPVNAADAAGKVEFSAPSAADTVELPTSAKAKTRRSPRVASNAPVATPALPTSVPAQQLQLRAPREDSEPDPDQPSPSASAEPTNPTPTDSVSPTEPEPATPPTGQPSTGQPNTEQPSSAQPSDGASAGVSAQATSPAPSPVPDQHTAAASGSEQPDPAGQSSGDTESSGASEQASPSPTESPLAAPEAAVAGPSLGLVVVPGADEVRVGSVSAELAAAAVEALASIDSRALGVDRTAASTAPEVAAAEVTILTGEDAPGGAAVAATIVRTDVDTPGTGGAVEVAVDASGFALAIGSDFATRMRLRVWPVCALDADPAPGCDDGGRWVPTTVDGLTARAVVPVDVPRLASDAQPGSGVVVGLVGGPDGRGGDFRSTTPSASGTWEAGGASGDFTYEAPVDVPPAQVGSDPDVSLSYSAQAVDGVTSHTNGQSSWAGVGWSFHPGSISVSYSPCASDGLDELWTDLCWESPYADPSQPMASVSVAGISSNLIWAGTGTDPARWRVASDNGWTVNRHTGAPNGDAQGQWWELTDPSGTRFIFGCGFSSTDCSGNASPTHSVSVVPVFSNNAGEPGFAGGEPVKAVRGYEFALDKVIDSFGNTTVYTYTQETNHYRRQVGENQPLEAYTSASYPATISYGFNPTADESTGLAHPTARVDFRLAGRCANSVISQVDPGGLANPPDPAVECPPGTGNSIYPDTPIDLRCTAEQTDCANTSPTFFDTLRLFDIVTSVDPGGTGDWAKARRTVFKHVFPELGDDPGPAGELWLSWMQASAFDSAGSNPTRAPLVAFTETPLANRLPDGAPYQYLKPRLTGIVDELGGHTAIAYTDPITNCPALSSNWSTNTRRCWSNGTDRYNKYVVATVTEDSRITVSRDDTTPPVVTHYTYPDDAAWAYGNDLLTAHQPDGTFDYTADQGWGTWRGYRQLTTRVGDETAGRTVEHFLTGMDGDAELVDGELRARNRSVTGPDGQHIPDSANRAGDTLWTATVDGDGETQAIEYSPAVQVLHTWSAPDRGKGWPDHSPVILRPDVSETRALRRDGTWQVTQSNARYNNAGMPVSQTEATSESWVQGTPFIADDITCTLTEYTPPAAGSNLIGYPARVQVLAGGCDSDPTISKDLTHGVISDTSTYYDGHTSLTEPVTRGAVTGTSTTTGYDAAGNLAACSTSTAVVDVFGRPTQTTVTTGDLDPSNPSSVTNTGQFPTRYVYEVIDGRLVNTSIITVGGIDRKSVTISDAASGNTLASTDPDGYTTRQRYDGLGRVAAVTAPATGVDIGADVATYSYSDLAWANDPANTGDGIKPINPGIVVSSAALDDAGRWQQSWAWLDGDGETVQTQRAGIDPADPTQTSGRLITTQWSNDRGLVVASMPEFHSTGAPGEQLWIRGYQDPRIPTTSQTRYDSLNRPIRTTGTRDGDPELVSTAQYWADQTLAHAPERNGVPAGGDQLTITDASGRTTAITDYPGKASAGGGITTTYTYDGADNLTSWTRYNRTWTARYDLADRLIESTDPDTGRTITFYRPDGLPQLTRTGGAGQGAEQTWTRSTWTDYDELGRPTDVRDISAAGDLGTTLTATSYDPDGHFGQIAATESKTRFADHDLTLRTETSGWDQFNRPITSTTRIAGLDLPDGVPHEMQTSVELTVAGDVKTVHLPAAGGLPAQAVTTEYTVTGLPHKLTLDGDLIGQNTYTNTGRLSQRAWPTGAGGVGMHRSIAWDETLDAPTSVVTSLTGAATSTLQDDRYTWDAADNLTEVADHAADPANPAAGTSKRCNVVDGLGRLTNAYTTSLDTDCATSAGQVPDVTSGDWLTGVAPSFSSWTFDGTDRITGRVEGVKDADGTATANDYGYTFDPAHPNRLSTLVVTGKEPATISYDYTGSGDLAKTTVRGEPEAPALGGALAKTASGKIADQTWTYDALGQPISAAVADGKTTSMAWGPDGSRWLVSDGDTTTWYSPAGEITWNSSGEVTAASRAHALAGAIVATTSLTSTGTPATVWTADDLAGNAIIQADPALVTATATTGWARRHYDTHGQLIATTGDKAYSWAGSRAWQGLPTSTADLDGVTNVGARMFDTVAQLFTTPDPIQDPYTAAAANPYAYAADNAASVADPDGLFGARIRQAASSVARTVTKAVSSAVSTTRKVASKAVKTTTSKVKAVAKAAKRTYTSVRKVVRETTAKAKTVAKKVTKKVKTTAKSAAKAVKKVANNPTVKKVAGVAAGIAAGVVATAAVAAVCATGVGCVALGLAAAGAASSIADGIVNGHSAAEIARSATIGAVMSVATLGVGKIAGPAARAASGKLGGGVRQAVQVRTKSGGVVVSETHIPARAVRFTQDSIGPEFKSGGSIFKLADEMAASGKAPADLPPIRIFEQGGQIYSLDNRRLFAGQYADVDLPYVWATARDIARRKQTQVYGGTGVTIRGKGGGWWSLT